MLEDASCCPSIQTPQTPPENPWQVSWAKPQKNKPDGTNRFKTEKLQVKATSYNIIEVKLPTKHHWHIPNCLRFHTQLLRILDRQSRTKKCCCFCKNMPANCSDRYCVPLWGKTNSTGSILGEGSLIKERRFTGWKIL